MFLFLPKPTEVNNNPRPLSENLRSFLQEEKYNAFSPPYPNVKRAWRLDPALFDTEDLDDANWPL